MGAMGVVNATEALLNALAMGVAAGNRSQAPIGDSPRTVAAVRHLIHQLNAERAARAALEEEVAVLRHALEEAGAQIMRMRTRAGN